MLGCFKLSASSYKTISEEMTRWIITLMVSSLELGGVGNYEIFAIIFKPFNLFFYWSYFVLQLKNPIFSIANTNIPLS